MKESGIRVYAIVCETQRELFTLICEQGEIHAKLRDIQTKIKRT